MQNGELISPHSQLFVQSCLERLPSGPLGVHDGSLQDTDGALDLSDGLVHLGVSGTTGLQVLLASQGVIQHVGKALDHLPGQGMEIVLRI